MDFWSCAQQQIAAWHYSPFAQQTSPTEVESSPSHKRLSPRSDSAELTESTEEHEEKPLVEGIQVRNTTSIAALRLKAQEHVASLEVSAS